MRHLPHTTEAWAEGAITPAQVDVITSLRDDVTEEALTRDEEMLVGYAATMPYAAFVKAADYWKQLADIDGAEEDDQEPRDRRDVYLDESFGGMWFGKVTLDPISGAMVGGELEGLEKEMFEADWAAVRHSLGCDPTSSDRPDPRSTPGRRAGGDGTRSRSSPADGRRPAALLSILTPGRRVEVSATARLCSGATRRAIELRDRECTHPYFDVPGPSCQVDHIIPFSHGGRTVEENGRLLRSFHNRPRNHLPFPDD